MLVDIHLIVRDKIEKSDDENPYDVHKVPIQRDNPIRAVGRDFRRPVVRQNGQIAEHQNAHRHMRGMECGDGVKNRSV